MQFSSRPPFNDDPYPNVWNGHSPRNQMRVDTDMYRRGAPYNHESYSYKPPPEFDRPQHNPTNPILEWQRKTTRPGWAAVAARYVLDRWDATIGALPALGIITYTPNMEQHALRVLTRVASFGERNS